MNLSPPIIKPKGARLVRLGISVRNEQSNKLTDEERYKRKLAQQAEYRQRKKA